MPRTGCVATAQKIELTPGALEQLAALQVTQREIAAYFGVDLGTVENRLAEREYRAAYDRGAAQGMMSLRRWQMKAASEGDRVMLIWLGKQILNQREPEQRLEHSGPGGSAINYEDLSPTQREDRLAKLIEKRDGRKTQKRAAAKAGRALVEQQAAQQRQA